MIHNLIIILAMLIAAFFAGVFVRMAYEISREDKK